MKKLLLATAIAALSVSAANAAPTVYGKAFVTTDYVNADLDVRAIDAPFENVESSSDSLQVNSNISRLGFKGSEAMTANTDVIYQLEYGIRIDGTDDNIGLKSRDTYLGLDNKQYGQFRFGRNYSVSDYINNVTVTEGYWDNIGASSLNGGTVAEALTLTDGDRVNNSIVWQAPKYNNLPLELALQYGADETFSDSKDNGYGASLMYDPGNGFTAGIAYDKDMSIKTGGDILRGSITADLGKYVAYPVKMGVLYQQADFDGADTEDGLVVSAKMGLTNFARPTNIYAQYNRTNSLSGLDGNDSNQFVVGTEYFFKKNMMAHAYAGYNSADLDNDTFVARRPDDNADQIVKVRARGDASVLAIGAGLEYLF